ncbi:DNA-deoxyinosine glycosylase [Aurantiacibacter xanthus]|uniref:DNA-deoxyinosine glycosylase n=1 Tax=Aurantiacibacter xanthus TaxID=1784712 RepID=A0A3A1P671_9SPHN|nr:DNA-deoxyinosine glycosylase [Aurantiacibacter xanthus]RIV86412.1 DNA-deoxyinosine glycosylase [Aurantiacibacter xanthus]
MSLRKSGFGAVVDDDTRLVILGSLPGERSLAERRYYAHPGNGFWHLVGAVISCDLVSRDYAARLDTLRAHRIGLWDVVASAERSGSLDTAIRAHEANPLADFAASLPNLRALAFNGAKAAAIGRRQLAGQAAPDLIDLPSSSAAYAAMPLAEKASRWMSLRKFVG